VPPGFILLHRDRLTEARHLLSQPFFARHHLPCSFFKAAEVAEPKCVHAAGYHLCKGLVARWSGEPREAVRHFNLARSDGTWGSQAIMHMVEVRGGGTLTWLSCFLVCRYQSEGVYHVHTPSWTTLYWLRVSPHHHQHQHHRRSISTRTMMLCGRSGTHQQTTARHWRRWQLHAHCCHRYV
jgi:hypothetical protein